MYPRDGYIPRMATYVSPGWLYSEDGNIVSLRWLNSEDGNIVSLGWLHSEDGNIRIPGMAIF